MDLSFLRLTLQKIKTSKMRTLLALSILLVQIDLSVLQELIAMI
jgi:hypothetical protein